MKKLILFCLCFVVTFICNAQTTSALDNYILNKLHDAPIPGLAFALIKDGKIALTKGYGFADVDKDIPFTPNTIQHEVASISKIVTATAVMKLWEQGRFQLDDPINNYLPFPVINPSYSGTAITFRMLLCHTSSIAGNDVDLNYGYVPPGTEQELGNFLYDVLTPGAALYQPGVCYNNYAPGTQFRYSNVGYALLGYLIQRISGMPFDQYCAQNIFQPLCMNHTWWFHNQVNPPIVSIPYVYSNNSVNSPVAWDLYERPDYPCVTIKSTVIDFSKFMLMHMNFGILNGVRIIDSTTEVMMRTVQIATNLTEIGVTVNGQPVNYEMLSGLGLNSLNVFSDYNRSFLGWAGLDPGVSTFAWINPSDNTGIVIFANCGFRTFSNVHANNSPFFTSNEVLDIALMIEKYVADTISIASAPVLNCSYQLNPCEHNTDYWIAHTTDWALSTVPMKLGTKAYYNKNQTLELLNSSFTTDASIILAKSLIAAKLNVAQGSELAPVYSTINSAMNLIGNHRLPYDNPVSFSSPTGIQMLALAATLDSYNSGSLNTTACSGSPTSITRSNPVSEIDRSTLSYSFSVYPNPSNGSANISLSLPGSGKVSLTIYDVTGKLIKTIANRELNEGVHTFNLDVNNFRAGIYLLRMQSGGISQTRKFIVQH